MVAYLSRSVRSGTTFVATFGASVQGRKYTDNIFALVNFDIRFPGRRLLLARDDRPLAPENEPRVSELRVLGRDAAIEKFGPVRVRVRIREIR